MAQLPLPVGKQEFYDGTNWYSTASENWVLNNIRNISPCLAATTNSLTATYSNGTNGVGATLTNSGTQAALAFDGVIFSVGNKVLVKDQPTFLQNGIYTVTNVGSASTNWVLTRTNDYDSPSQIIRGDVISVISGTLSAASLWMLVTNVNAVGTDPFNFIKTDQNSFNSILGTNNQINVSIVAGVATLSLSNSVITPGTLTTTGDLTVNSTSKFKIAVGTTAQRPSTPVVGDMRLNTSL